MHEMINKHSRSYASHCFKTCRHNKMHDKDMTPTLIASKLGPEHRLHAPESQQLNVCTMKRQHRRRKSAKMTYTCKIPSAIVIIFLLSSAFATAQQQQHQLHILSSEANNSGATNNTLKTSTVQEYQPQLEPTTLSLPTTRHVLAEDFPTTTTPEPSVRRTRRNASESLDNWDEDVQMIDLQQDDRTNATTSKPKLIVSSVRRPKLNVTHMRLSTSQDEPSSNNTTTHKPYALVGGDSSDFNATAQHTSFARPTKRVARKHHNLYDRSYLDEERAHSSDLTTVSPRLLSISGAHTPEVDAPSDLYAATQPLGSTDDERTDSLATFNKQQPVVGDAYESASDAASSAMDFGASEYRPPLGPSAPLTLATNSNTPHAILVSDSDYVPSPIAYTNTKRTPSGRSRASSKRHRMQQQQQQTPNTVEAGVQDYFSKHMDSGSSLTTDGLVDQLLYQQQHQQQQQIAQQPLLDGRRSTTASISSNVQRVSAPSRTNKSREQLQREQLEARLLQLYEMDLNPHKNMSIDSAVNTEDSYYVDAPHNRQPQQPKSSLAPYAAIGSQSSTSHVAPTGETQMVSFPSTLPNQLEHPLAMQQPYSTMFVAPEPSHTMSARQQQQHQRRAVANQNMTTRAGSNKSSAKTTTRKQQPSDSAIASSNNGDQHQQAAGNYVLTMDPGASSSAATAAPSATLNNQQVLGLLRAASSPFAPAMPTSVQFPQSTSPYYTNSAAQQSALLSHYLRRLPLQQQQQQQQPHSYAPLYYTTQSSSPNALASLLGAATPGLSSPTYSVARPHQSMMYTAPSQQMPSLLYSAGSAQRYATSSAVAQQPMPMATNVVQRIIQSPHRIGRVSTSQYDDSSAGPSAAASAGTGSSGDPMLSETQTQEEDYLQSPQTIQITAVPNAGLGANTGWGNNWNGWNGYYGPWQNRQVLLVNRQNQEWRQWILPVAAILALPLILGALFVPAFLKSVMFLIQILQMLGLLMPPAQLAGHIASSTHGPSNG